MTLSRAQLPPDPAEWLDLYLDDLLDPSCRAEFEARLAREPQLAAAVRLQRRIDADLRSALGQAPPPALSSSVFSTLRLAPAEAETVPLGSPRSRPAARPGRPAPSVLARWRPVLLAAGLALAALGAWYVAQQQRSADIKYVEPAELYARLKAGGFTPEFVCKDDAEFAAAVNNRLGASLALGSSSGVNLLGWAYGKDYQGRIIGPDTLVLMARLDGQHEVVVLMDKAASDRTLTPPPASSPGPGALPLSLFRRELGPFVLYEITPLPQPRLLEHFRAP